MKPDWDHEVDVLVVGSGAGGMVAALAAAQNNANVLIIEKAKLWGGSSASSGGGIWVPGSHVAKASGFDDDIEGANRYVRSLSADNVPDANIRAYVEKAAPVLEWLMESTPIDYIAFPYPDYHAERDGGSPTGFRTHMPVPIDGRKLGKDVATMRPANPAACLFGYLNWHFDETHMLLYRMPGWWKMLAKNMLKYWLDIPFRFKSRKDRRLTLGGALTGALRIALNEKQVPVWLESPMSELIKEDGHVVGVAINRGGKTQYIKARKGVVLAAGGMDKNGEMRKTNAPLYPNAQYSGGVTSNTGDSIKAAMKMGGGTMNLHSAWAAPVFYVPGEAGGRLSTMERALPGTIMVNQKGERYLNEALDYHTAGQEMAKRHHEYGDASPSYMIFDHKFRQQFPMGPLYPLMPEWLHNRGVRSSLKKAKTISGLAEKLNMTPHILEATLSRFNEHAAKGEDPDFHRGEAAYDKMYGDPRQTPNPCLRPIDQGPYYAMPIYPGDIGMNGGLMTNEKAQVLGQDNAPITGLYAVGNNAASAMGESYPGAGVTLMPAMTFAYIAAQHITRVNQ